MTPSHQLTGISIHKYGLCPCLLCHGVDVSVVPVVVGSIIVGGKWHSLHGERGDEMRGDIQCVANLLCLSDDGHESEVSLYLSL